jgi:uncharacterized short protein YbdD (DUF466 family)
MRKRKKKKLTAEELIRMRKNNEYVKHWRETHPDEYRKYMRDYMREYNAKAKEQEQEQNLLQKLADFFKRLWFGGEK